jgi:hypothetical protein
MMVRNNIIYVASVMKKRKWEMLIVDTPEDNLKQRIKELEEYVLRIESSRCNIAVRLEKVEERLKKLESK